MLTRYAEVRANSDDVAMGLLLKYSRRALVDWQNSFVVLSEQSHYLDNYGTLTGIRTYDDLLWKMAEQGTDVHAPLVQQVIHALAEFLVFRNNMMVLRKFWSPQTGKGSQITSHESHLALHELCVAKLQERLKAYSEESE
jgi:hypothetical protein